MFPAVLVTDKDQQCTINTMHKKVALENLTDKTHAVNMQEGGKSSREAVTLNSMVCEKVHSYSTLHALD